jgi:DNA-binding CsgD family transcriptional regulator
MSALMEPQRTRASSTIAGRHPRVETEPQPHEPNGSQAPAIADGSQATNGTRANGARALAEASEVRESLARLSLSPSPTLIFEVDAGGSTERSKSARRWDVRLVGSVRNRERRPDTTTTPAGGAASSEVSAVLIIRAMTPPALLATVRAMTRGGATVPREMVSQMIPRPADANGDHPEDLTSREQAVLHMLADGLTTREIAEELSYSERTVKNIVHDVLEKLGCRTRAHAVAIATRHGVI